MKKDAKTLPDKPKKTLEFESFVRAAMSTGKPPKPTVTTKVKAKRRKGDK